MVAWGSTTIRCSTRQSAFSTTTNTRNTILYQGTKYMFSCRIWWYSPPILRICNLICLVIHLNLNCYPTNASRLSLVGILLIGATLLSSTPLLENNSSLLQDFEKFIKYFQESFGDTDRLVWVGINKLCHLWQGDRPTFAYVPDFHLYTKDIDQHLLMLVILLGTSYQF